MSALLARVQRPRNSRYCIIMFDLHSPFAEVGQSASFDVLVPDDWR